MPERSATATEPKEIRPVSWLFMIFVGVTVAITGKYLDKHGIATPLVDGNFLFGVGNYLMGFAVAGLMYAKR